MAKFRIGHGYDVHKLVSERALILGGVDIPHTLGLLGHSDADVLVHAIMDAIIGALGEGDIGLHFPDTSSEFKDVSSMLLLRRVADEAKKRNLGINIHVSETTKEFDDCVEAHGTTPSNTGFEYFNPDVSSHAEKLEFSTIRVNGEIVTDIGEFVRRIVFDDIYSDGKSSGKGSIDKIILK